MTTVTRQVQLKVTEVLIVRQYTIEIQRIAFVISEIDIGEDNRRRVHEHRVGEVIRTAGEWYRELCIVR